VDINGSLITPVYKEGDPFNTANNRLIAMIEPIMRLYGSILTARLVEFTERHSLRIELQMAFKPELAMTHQLLAMEHFISESQHARTPLYACFLDLKGAYCKIQQPLLWQTFVNIGKAGAAWAHAWCLGISV